MVLPDEDAADIYQNTNANLQANSNTNVSGPAANNLNKIYNAGNINTKLVYGNIYEFRIRLTDTSGGGPTVNDNPVYSSPSPQTPILFKRYVAPNALRIQDLLETKESKFFTDNAIKVQRPLLGYPSVVFTGKYTDPVSLLKAASLSMMNKEAFGISDPDVSMVEITVEIKNTANG